MARERGIAGQEEQTLALGLLIFAFSFRDWRLAIRCQTMYHDLSVVLDSRQGD